MPAILQTKPTNINELKLVKTPTTACDVWSSCHRSCHLSFAPDGYGFGSRGAEGCQIGDEPETEGDHFHLCQPFYLNLPYVRHLFHTK